MTHREGEPYSLIDLRKIPGDTARGVNPYSPFYPFSPSYIADVTKFTTKLPTNVPPNLYSMIEGVGFLDSLHDFKSDFMDCQAPIKGDPNNFSFKKFGFSFLLNGGYPSLLTKYPKLLMQTGYSYLNRIPRPLNESNLENYFSLGNIYDVINDSERGSMYILPNTRTGANNEAIYRRLQEFFAAYKDANFGNTIKVIVDHQLNFYEIIRTTSNSAQTEGFSVLYTAETITDPAPKSKAQKLDLSFGSQNCYIEKLPKGKERRYNASEDGIGGNVNVTFTNLSITSGDLENGTYSVDVVYENQGKSNPLETVNMNLKGNSINAIKNQIRKTIERVVGTVAETFSAGIFPKTLDTREEFYKTFNQGMNADKKLNYSREYSIFYARKRLGDTLQARICLPDKLNGLEFNSVKKVPGTGKSTYTLDTTRTIQASTGAVLVTHDRMLFSYAVIQGIPTILDLENNMIVFVPPTPPTGPRLPGYSGGGVQQIVPKINTYNFNKNPTNLIQKGGNIFDTDDAVDSIMNNVDDLIRFLYFYNNGNSKLMTQNFRGFIKSVQTGLDNYRLKYAYLGNYYNNCLIIAQSGILDAKITAIKAKAETGKGHDLRNGLFFNPTLLAIYISDTNYITVEKIAYPETRSTPYDVYRETNYYLRVCYNSNNCDRDNQDMNYDEIARQVNPNNTTAKTVINNLRTIGIKSGQPANDNDTVNQIYEDLVINLTPNSYIRNRNVLGSLAGVLLGGIAGYFSTGSLIVGSLAGLGTGVGVGKATGYLGGGEPNDVPLYESVLTADFNKLNDPKNLFQNNVTVIYFLFNLLRSYELSFIDYQEGIESFYTKIDESCVLSDMIGVTNLIPHNNEFYVFLKLILQDYSEKNVNTINYALFEYYLYLLKGVNNIYYRFQDIKSYLLNTNYEIPFTPEIQSAITSTNMQSLQYFNSVCQRARNISQDIIVQNYNASQSDNFDIIHKNADDYSLKLCGFTEMKSEFINTTVDIVSSMMSKGLLLNYEKSNKEGTSSQDDYTNMPDAAGIQPNSMMQTPMQVIQPTAIAAFGGKKVAKTLRRKSKNKNNSKKRKVRRNTKKINKKKSYKKRNN